MCQRTRTDGRFSELNCLPTSCTPYSAGAASGLIDDGRPQGSYAVAGEDDQQVQTPPRWRRISAATPSVPHQEYSTSPSIREQGNSRQSHNNLQRGEGDITSTGEGAEYSPHSHLGGVSGYGGDARAAREPDHGGQYYGDRLNQREGNCHWGGR